MCVYVKYLQSTLLMDYSPIATLFPFHNVHYFICRFSSLQAAECFMADFAFLNDNNVIFLINLNNAAPFPGSVPVAFFVAKTRGWHSHVDNHFSKVRRLWISFEVKNLRFIFAWIDSIQMNEQGL